VEHVQDVVRGSQPQASAADAARPMAGSPQGAKSSYLPINTLAAAPPPPPAPAPAPVLVKPPEDPMVKVLPEPGAEPVKEPVKQVAAAAPKVVALDTTGEIQRTSCAMRMSGAPGDCAGPVGPGGPVGPPAPMMPDRPVPTELALVSHPPYMIEPPDILLIDTIRMIPRPPYVVQPMDALLIKVAEALPNQPLDGIYTVGPDGSVNLGFNYGVVRVAGLELEAAQEAIRKHLGRILKNPQVAVALSQFRGFQQVRGEHLVRQDGTISLGTYGGVYVTGLTIPQAKAAIERHLAQFVAEPEVSVDVFAYNSKSYYVIADGGGFGQQVFRFPITGKETVLDAIGQIQGLPAVASKRRIWVARPAPADYACTQILPVDWRAITEGGSTCTNYQIFPGDRIYLKADCLIAINNAIAKVVAPIERLFGITLLGATTVQEFRNNRNNGNGTGAIFTVGF
jgi:polysaccharide export outer membrane protein